MAAKRTRILECKTVPGVKVTLFNTTLRRRMELQSMNIKEFKGDPEAPGAELQTMEAANARAWQTSKAQGVLLRWAIKDISGYEIEDEQGQAHPATPETLADGGAITLVEEILVDIYLDMGLLEKEGESLPSPTTSAARADGESGATTA